MRDEAMTEFKRASSVRAGNAKTGAWNAYDVWKTTIHAPRGDRSMYGSGSFGDYLDEEEDRVKRRVRKLRRLLVVVLLVIASGMGLLADHYLSAAHTQRSDRVAVTTADG